MSEFSPLRDPVFLLTWQVHLAVVILFTLLGIWAGMTRRACYVVPTLSNQFSRRVCAPPLLYFTLSASVL